MPATLDLVPAVAPVPGAAPRASRSDAGIVTLGIEEELQVVDAAGALAAHDFDRGGREVPDREGSSSREIHRCVIEVKTRVCSSPDQAVRALAVMRAVAARRAALQGQRVLAAALHPFSRWPEQALHDEPGVHPHYAHLLDEYGEVARAALTYGLHVHLGVSRPQWRMPVMNALRTWLPEVLALSASGPFFEGRDTGLQSWRHSQLDRYPRMGIPEVWPNEEAYWAHVHRLRRVGSIEPDQGLWEDLRLHHRYGTLEVRVCDATPSLDRVWLIVALLQAEVTTLEAELAQGRPLHPVPRSLLEDSKWRARRRGLAATVVDWATEREQPVRQRLAHWLARVHPAAQRLGFATRLAHAMEAALAEGSSADQQRGWWRDSGGSFAAVIDALVAQTAQPLSPALERAHG